MKTTTTTTTIVQFTIAAEVPDKTADKLRALFDEFKESVGKDQKKLVVSASLIAKLGKELAPVNGVAGMHLLHIFSALYVHGVAAEDLRVDLEGFKRTEGGKAQNFQDN